MTEVPPTRPQPHADPDAQQKGSTRHRSRAQWELGRPTRLWLITLVTVLLVYVAGTLVHPRYVVYRPGLALDTLGNTLDGKTPMIEVRGAPTYPTSGSLELTTVSLYGGPGFELTLWDFLRFRLAGAEMMDRDDVYPAEVTRDEVSELNRAEMATSQHEAVAVALRATGRTVPERAVVEQVARGAPAEGVLRDGDVITAVAGTPVTEAGQVSEFLQRTPDGKPVDLALTRAGARQTVSVTPVRRENRKVVGVIIASQFDFPVEVTINAGQVGGPSAGLMFSLGVYDKLTPGPLTGGQKIAGTGTITSAGVVGRIGGIEHKLAGAQASGAGWFLAPGVNCPDVAGNVPDGLRVVKVGTFTEAKAAVTKIAAGQTDGLPSCS